MIESIVANVLWSAVAGSIVFLLDKHATAYLQSRQATPVDTSAIERRLTSLQGQVNKVKLQLGLAPTE